AVQSFKTAYTSNSDSHGHTDIQAAYNSGNMGTSSVASIAADTNYSGSLGTQGWALGSSHKDGSLWVNNTQVNSSNSMEIYSRCEASMGNCSPATAYHYVEGNKQVDGAVYWHYANFYFGSNDTVQTLVHFGSNGQVDLAMWVPCGNVIFVVPKAPPVQQITCDE